MNHRESCPTNTHRLVYPPDQEACNCGAFESYFPMPGPDSTVRPDNLPYVETLEKAVRNATPEIRRQAARDVLDIIQESIPPMYKNHTVVTEILEKAMQNVAKEFSTP